MTVILAGEEEEYDEFDAHLDDLAAGASALQPPRPKQGGSNTSNLRKADDQPGFWCGVDYLTVSHPRHFYPGQICRELENLLGSTGQEAAGEHGYTGKDICAGYGKVLRRDSRDSGDGDVLVRLPGRALDWIRDTNALSDTELQCTDADICRLFDERGFHSTRIDIAMDSDDRRISPAAVEQLIEKNSYVCRAKRAGLTDSWNTENPKTRREQETVYLGSRSSGRYFRCYNKAADIFRKTGRNVGHLTRFELEMKGEAARKTMQLIVRYGHYCIPQLFAAWVDFKDPSDDATRIERHRSIAWWDELINGAEPLGLGLKRGVATPEQSLRWVKEQVSKTLFLAHRHGLFDEIIAAINAKKYKIKPSENAKWKYFAAVKKAKGV